MLVPIVIGLALASLLFFVVHRGLQRRREHDDWEALAIRFPASDAPYEGARFRYPDTGGEAIVGEEGFRAQPTDSLHPIDVPWSDVKAVRSRVGGGLSVHVPGGMVLLPGASSAFVAEVIARRARRRQQVSA